MNSNVRTILGLGVIGAALYLIWKNNRNQMVSGLQTVDETKTEPVVVAGVPKDKLKETAGIKPVRSSMAVSQESNLPVLENQTGTVVPLGGDYTLIQDFNGDSPCTFC